MADVAGIAHEAIEDVEFPDDSHATSTGISNAKLAMWVYLASDALLFGGLITVAALYGWIMEPSTDPSAGHDDHDEPSDGDPSGEAAAEETDEESGDAAPSEEAALVD